MITPTVRQVDEQMGGDEFGPSKKKAIGFPASSVKVFN